MYKKTLLSKINAGEIANHSIVYVSAPEFGDIDKNNQYFTSRQAAEKHAARQSGCYAVYHRVVFDGDIYPFYEEEGLYRLNVDYENAQLKKAAMDAHDSETNPMAAEVERAFIIKEANTCENLHNRLAAIEYQRNHTEAPADPIEETHESEAAPTKAWKYYPNRDGVPSRVVVVKPKGYKSRRELLETLTPNQTGMAVYTVRGEWFKDLDKAQHAKRHYINDGYHARIYESRVWFEANGRPHLVTFEDYEDLVTIMVGAAPEIGSLEAIYTSETLEKALELEIVPAGSVVVEIAEDSYIVNPNARGENAYLVTMTGLFPLGSAPAPVEDMEDYVSTEINGRGELESLAKTPSQRAAVAYLESLPNAQLINLYNDYFEDWGCEVEALEDGWFRQYITGDDQLEDRTYTGRDLLAIMEPYALFENGFISWIEERMRSLEPAYAEDGSSYYPYEVTAAAVERIKAALEDLDAANVQVSYKCYPSEFLKYSKSLLIKHIEAEKDCRLPYQRAADIAKITYRGKAVYIG